MIRIGSLTIAILVSCALAGQAGANDIRYTVTDLGTLGGPTSVALAISQNGIIVGGAEVPKRGNHPFVYQGGGPMQDLGLLDPINGEAGEARSVNSQGQVVGSSADVGVTSPAYGFYYSGTGPLINLGTLGGQSSYAFGINESGQIVGNAQTASGAWHGILWTVGGASVDLGAGFLTTAISNNGLIGGVARQTNDAALYNISSGSITDLGTLSGGTWSQVNALNDEGLVVGESDTIVQGVRSTHAFLYDIATGVLSDLGNPASALWASNAGGVNDLGQVVGGYSLDAAEDAAAFIYTRAGGMQNLNGFIDPTSGYTIIGASGINDTGEIVGCGWNPEGQFHALLLTPVPEPSSMELVTAVLGIVAGRLAWGRVSWNLIRLRDEMGISATTKSEQL